MSYFDNNEVRSGTSNGTSGGASNASSVGPEPSVGATCGAGNAPSVGAEPSVGAPCGARNELDDMFFNRAGEPLTEETGKVLVKTNEVGYGTVLGVVMIIVSISFILAALFIRMLI